MFIFEEDSFNQRSILEVELKLMMEPGDIQFRVAFNDLRNVNQLYE